MRRTVAKRWTRCIAMALVLALMLTACQPTPEEEAVQNKGDKDLQSEILQEAEASLVIEEEGFTYEKTYENTGIRFVVDAPIKNTMEGGAAVLSVEQNPFTEEQVKHITQLMYPDEEIFDAMEVATKESYENEILRYRRSIYYMELDLQDGSDDPYLVENIASYKAYLAELEDAYADAPEEQHKPVTYTFREYISDGMQSEGSYMFTYAGAPRAYENRENFYFHNDEMDSYMSINRRNITSEIPDEFSKLHDRNYGGRPEEFQEKEGFQEAVTIAKDFVRQMGLDYMQLNYVEGKEEDGHYYYSLTFMRSYNGLAESYVSWTYDESGIQTDTSVAMKLWEPEELFITVYDGEVVNARWQNPTKVTAVDNENVALLPWEDIQEIFKKQMDYHFATSGYMPRYEMMVENNEYIKINEVELGYAKLLMKDTNTYKLIPVWSFFGVDVNAQTGIEANWGRACYATINAIDGTVIDRGLMY